MILRREGRKIKELWWKSSHFLSHYKNVMENKWNEWFKMTWVDIYIKWEVQAFKAHVQLTEMSITLKRSRMRQNLQHEMSFSHWNASNYVKTPKLNFSQILAKLVKITKMPLKLIFSWKLQLNPIDHKMIYLILIKIV